MPSFQSIIFSVREFIANMDRKTVVIISLILGFGLILGLLMVLTGDSRNNTTGSQSNSSINTATVRYNDDSLFTKVSDKVHSSEFLMFTGESDLKTNAPQYFFQKPEATITKSNSLFETDGPFLQDSQYILSKDELLINEGSGSYIFTAADGKTTPINTPTGDKVQSVVPVRDIVDDSKISQFYFLTQKLNDNKDKVLTIQKTPKLDFVGASEILVFDPSKLETKYDKIEIRVMNSQPYILGYQFAAEQNLDIYRIDSTKLTKKVSIFDFDGIVFGNKSRIFYTNRKSVANELGLYNHGIVDFKDSFSPSNSYFEFTRNPRLDNIQGELISSKCNWDNGDQNIYCPIKVNNAIPTASNQVDEIIRYNVVDSSISYPFRGIGVSISRIFFDSNNSVYFISQGSNSLYKVKK
jgi:hypothetical protein